MDVTTIAAICTISATIGGCMVGVNVLFVRYVVRDEISKLNGTYVRSQGSTITGAEIERRLEALEN